jgi:hypothetical protein
MSLPAFSFTGRATPFLEIGIGDSRIGGGQAKWDVARWDSSTAKWAGTEPTWLDVSCETFSTRCEYGRQRSNDRFVPGVATIELLNATGWADPVASADPAVLSMRPGRSIRFGVDHVVYGRVVLWRGFIDAMVPTYDPTQPDVVTLTCVDALGEVNRAKFAKQASSGDGETVTSRAARVLDLASWPATKRTLEATSTTLVADELNGQAADLLGRTADSGGAHVYGDRDANVVLRARDWQSFVPGAPVDATIGNVGTTDVCPTGWRRPFARADITTRAIMGRDPETAIVRDDTAGQLVYGIEPFERVDLWTQNDTDIGTLADRVLRVRSYTTAPVVRGVTLDAATADDALDVMTRADPYKPTRYRCRLQLDGRTVFDAAHITTGVVHEITRDRWDMTMMLDLAAPYQTSAGRWDGARWDRAMWGTLVTAQGD